MVFQSTRPYGARRSNAIIIWDLEFCFNPRARMGRDEVAAEFAAGKSVSIHAPVWGATIARHFIGMNLMFQSTRPYGARLPGSAEQRGVVRFQSTRPYGARQGTCVISVPMNTFQSTRPYGARLEVTEHDKEFIDVSIHAPVWGATLGG